MEYACVDVDHAARRQLESFLAERAAGLGVELSGEHPVRCGVLGRRDQVAARDYFEIAVTECEAVQVVENLHVVLIAFGMVDGILMLPVVMVLVETKRPDAARRDVERGMAVVISVANGGGQQRSDEGIVDQLVAVGAAFVPGTDEVGFRFAAMALQLLDVLAHRVKSLDLFDQGCPGVVGEDVGKSDVAVVVERFEIGRGRAR